MTTHRVNVTRDGKWWTVSIPELDGLTQARRVGEVEQMALEYIAVTTGTRIEDNTVTISIDVDGVPAGERADKIHAARSAAVRLEAHALEEAKALAHELAEHNVPVRDIGAILGVTFQRASQLANS
ncbi:HicB family toxin-antitoxin system [Rhodococcus pyridinivorans]|uniref:HicB family toxin-antitoxin system n=1 Tax=Rhodococcus pyridinivorans TaxID=103816 RepID=UPI001E365DB1|nr:HicB family toxin-antitoxin system [Rhodococcus pyridinivorans]MCD5419800.1 HicB family toxin-antitoxin system [Rhodococcus pyridinivorans]